MPKIYGSIDELVSAIFSSNGHDITVSPVSASGPVTLSIPTTASDTFAMIAATQTLTNKTISGASNTISAIARSALNSGSANHVITNDGSGNLSSEAQLAITRGGTGQSTANTAFNALSPMTTNGDIIYRSGGIAARLAQGGSGTVLTSDGAGGFSWSAPFVNPMSNPGEIVYGGAGGVATALGAGTTNRVLQANGAGAPTWVEIVNANISASAAIDGSKIVAAGTDTQGVVSTGSQSFAGLKTFTNKIISRTASSGATASSIADQLVAEGSAGSGISILSGASSNGTLAFGDSGDSVAGRIVYNHSDNSMRFGTNLAADKVIIDSAGAVGIGTPSPNSSALLEISGTKSVLLPRLTTAERGALFPVDGMIIYNSTDNKLQVRASGAWVNLH